MAVYREELLDAERAGRAAYEAMERWVARPPDAEDDTTGATLEAHARDLRESRERLRELLSEHGNRDDIVDALARNEQYHAKLGLSMRGE